MVALEPSDAAIEGAAFNSPLLRPEASGDAVVTGVCRGVCMGCAGRGASAAAACLVVEGAVLLLAVLPRFVTADKNARSLAPPVV